MTDNLDLTEIEKQTPKKIESESWWNGMAYFCPTCKEDIRVKGADRCGKCGQKLDWSED